MTPKPRLKLLMNTTCEQNRKRKVQKMKIGKEALPHYVDMWWNLAMRIQSFVFDAAYTRRG